MKEILPCGYFSQITSKLEINAYTVYHQILMQLKLWRRIITNFSCINLGKVTVENVFFFKEKSEYSL